MKTLHVDWQIIVINDTNISKHEEEE
jgi:hypothetical protein